MFIQIQTETVFHFYAFQKLTRKIFRSTPQNRLLPTEFFLQTQYVFKPPFGLDIIAMKSLRWTKVTTAEALFYVTLIYTPFRSNDASPTFVSIRITQIKSDSYLPNYLHRAEKNFSIKVQSAIINLPLPIFSFVLVFQITSC